MMKFFALVALAMFATTNASTAVTGGAITRGTTYLTGVAGGDLVITFTATNGLADQNIVTFTPLQNVGAYFSGASPTCTYTGTGITGIAAAATTSSGVLAVTVSGTVASGVEVVITCTDNLAVNAAAGAKTFTIETTTDATVVTVDPGYTVTSAVTAFSASRGTTVVTALAPGSLVFGFTATTALAHSGTITLTSSVALFTASVDVACTAAVTGVASADVPTFVAADTESDSTGKILTLKLAATSTDVLAAGGVITITCTDNMLVNDAAGAVTFSIGTTSSTGGDVGPLTAQTGYTITTGVSAFSATRGTSYLTLEAPGDLVFKFTPTTQVAADTTDAVTLIASEEIFTGNTATACTISVASGTAPTSITTTVATKNTLKVTTVGGALLVNVAVTVTCTDNMAANTAAGDVTFSIATTGDIGPLVGQTGYTICAATGCTTSAASSTASVGMLTMLALAGVAMRQ